MRIIIPFALLLIASTCRLGALYAEYMTKVKTEERVLNSDATETGKKIQMLMQQGRTAEAGEAMKQTSGKEDN